MPLSWRSCTFELLRGCLVSWQLRMAVGHLRGGVFTVFGSGFRKLCTQLLPFVLLLEPKGDLIFVLGYRPWSIKKTLIIFKNSDKTAWRSATHAFNPNKERRGSCCQPGLQIELRATHRYVVRPCFKQQTKKKRCSEAVFSLVIFVTKLSKPWTQSSSFFVKAWFP